MGGAAAGEVLEAADKKRWEVKGDGAVIGESACI